MSQDNVAGHPHAVPGQLPPIPSLIKRNTLLFALSQAFVGTGFQMVPTLGAIMVVQLLGSAALAGLGVSLIGISRFVVAYPFGWLTDAVGRKHGFIIALGVAFVGSILTGSSMLWRSFPLLVLGLLVFGLGMGATQQLRLAAAEMYPPSRRAEGLGYVLTGSVIGALGAPLLISASQATSARMGYEPLALPWLLVPILLLPTMLLILRVHPDPKIIASQLEKYWKGYTPAPSEVAPQGQTTTPLGFLRRYPLLVAFVSVLAVQGNMTMVMAMTSLALHTNGHSTTAISSSVAVHVVGMFGFSLPLGRLTDRIGRRSTLIMGIVIAALGSGLVPWGANYWVVTTGTFLVGLGWSFVNVASTALVIDVTQTHERGRAIGANDTFSSISGIFLPLLIGPLVEIWGLASIAVVGAVIMVLPLVLVTRLREVGPGRYAVGTRTHQRV